MVAAGNPAKIFREVIAKDAEFWSWGKQHAHKEMMEFSPGDQVWFKPPGREKIFGTLVKYNKKTVTVITESGQKWNVSPHLLSKVIIVKERKQGNVIDLHKK